MCVGSGSTSESTLPRHYQRIWNRADPRGRHVLVRCYHGLGDTIQFIRYATMLESIASSVTVWCQPQLFPLISTVRGCQRLLALHDGDVGIDYDIDVEVMELPYVFRTTLETIPRQVPYLHVPDAAVHFEPTIGIAWRGGAWDPGRAIPFDLVARLLKLPSIRWISLQQDARDDERHPSLNTADVSTVLLTAQQMKGMDLVISVDTMAAHLAGALAVPVWTLLPYVADWRWLEERTDTPWYPTMRLFRQPAAGDWASVILEVSRALRDGSGPVNVGRDDGASG